MSQEATEYVEVTEEMLSAGLYELTEHSFGDDLKYVMECVFRAMFYAKNRSASSSKSERN